MAGWDVGFIGDANQWWPSRRLLVELTGYDEEDDGSFFGLFSLALRSVSCCD